MRLRVLVRLEPGETDALPAAGSPVRIEVRDTSLADAPARTLSSAETTTRDADAGGVVAEAVVDVPDGIAPGTQLTLYAQLEGGTREARSASASGRLPGDWITTRSYPLDPSTGDREVEVGLRRI